MSLKDWFIKQKIGHLWNEDVAQNEEILLLLASEKQWDDISEICRNDLKIPKIKIAYLKAYLIKRTKSPTIPTQSQSEDDKKNETEPETNKQQTKQSKKDTGKVSPRRKKNKKRGSKKNKQKSKQKAAENTNNAPIENNKQDEEESLIVINKKIETPKETAFELPTITKPEFKTNYLHNGLKYTEIPIISDPNDDYVQYFSSKQCKILRGCTFSSHISDAYNPQHIAEKYPDLTFKVKRSNTRDFRLSSYTLTISVQGLVHLCT